MASSIGTTAAPPPTRRARAADDAETEQQVEPYRFTPKLARRVTLLGAVVFIVFAALLLRLWALQVLAGTKYVAQAQANQYRILRVQAPRGPILDRNGKVLVTNAAATAVELWPANLPKIYLDRYNELVSLARQITGSVVFSKSFLICLS